MATASNFNHEEWAKRKQVELMMPSYAELSLMDDPIGYLKALARRITKKKRG